MGENQKLYLTHPSFPNSFDFPLEITSVETAQYNCVALALGDTENWWEADEGYVWLDDIEYSQSLSALKSLFEKFQFETADNSSFEDGYEKVALFSEDNLNCSHVARQLNAELWTSKLGVSYDISHKINALENGIYGKIVSIMKRKIPPQ
jgi:hypothetical protein